MEEDMSICQHVHSASCTHACQIVSKKKEKKCKALISNTRTPPVVPVKLCVPGHSYMCRHAAVKVCSLTFTALHLQMQHVYIHFQTFKHHKLKCQSCRNGGVVLCLKLWTDWLVLFGLSLPLYVHNLGFFTTRCRHIWKGNLKKKNW